MNYYEYNYKPNPVIGIWVVLVGLVTLIGVTIADVVKAMKTYYSSLQPISKRRG